MWMFFQVESYQWITNWYFSGYPDRRLALKGQRWDCLAQCQYSMTGWDRKLICNFYLSVAACMLVWVDLSLRNVSMLLRRKATSKQQRRPFCWSVWPFRLGGPVLGAVQANILNTSSSSSSAFPSYISGVHHFWVRFLRMWPFFNPTIKVVTFRLRGWCLLGVFLLPAFTRLGHECQDLLSPCDEMHMCTD